MHFKWKYDAPTPQQSQQAKELGDKLSMSPILAQLLIKRGITTESAAKRFFRPQLADLINPFLMKDMDVAVDRLNDAMGRKERILVYGDYDVDGCTAVALVYKFLQQFYSNIDYYIPDRYDEGYGVSQKGIDYAKQTGVKLIIILDCGIKAVKEIEYAKSLGIDFIICDHHVPDEVMPPAVAILNPKRTDDSYPFKQLCGCGVGFKFMQAFAKNNGIPFSRLIPLLDFCAVSIAADIVPVTDENRILAFHGLKQLNQNPSVGLKAIIDICGLNGREISMSDIIFKIGPRINASGRMENGKESVDLLVEKDFSLALKAARHINEYNEQRKDIDKQMTEEANLIVSKLENQKHQSSIVLYDENWKKGVIGIVASRLTEIYFRPTVVLTRDGDLATGSARSVMGFDVLRSHQKLSRPIAQLRRPFLRRRPHTEMGRYTRVPPTIPALCGRTYPTRTNGAHTQHRRCARLQGHLKAFAQRPEAILALRTGQHQTCVLHNGRVRLRNEQGGGPAARAHQVGTGRL